MTSQGSCRSSMSTTTIASPRGTRYNPNGSPRGIASLTTSDGRATILCRTRREPL